MDKTLVIGLGAAACAGRTPEILNQAGAATDAEVAVVRVQTAGIMSIDGVPTPPHPNSENFYYGIIRLPPGDHSFIARRVFRASVLVEPTGYIDAQRPLTFRLEAGHTYTFHADRTTGPGYQVFLWVEDAATGAVVAGQKGG